MNENKGAGAPPLVRVRKTARSADTFVRWEVSDAETFLQNRAAFQPLIAIELLSHATNLYETALPQPCTLVVGSEQHGISDKILSVCERAVYIPLYGVNSSMNVTHAPAVVLFEWQRQHNGNND